MEIGTVVIVKKPVLGNPIGSIGVSYELYARQTASGGLRGASFIFENGNYDGFSEEEIEQCLTVVYNEPAYSNYKFENVNKVAEDFRNGFWSFDYLKIKYKIGGIQPTPEQQAQINQMNANWELLPENIRQMIFQRFISPLQPELTKPNIQYNKWTINEQVGKYDYEKPDTRSVCLKIACVSSFIRANPSSEAQIQIQITEVHFITEAEMIEIMNKYRQLRDKGAIVTIENGMHIIGNRDGEGKYKTPTESHE